MLKIKCTVAIMVCVLLCGTAASQVAFVYSLPKTALKIEVTVEKTIEKPGEFYQYAQRYLATNNVITAEKTTCKIVSVNVTAQTRPNPAHTYSLNSLVNKNLSISVDGEGILTGLNNFVENKNIEVADETKAPLSKHQPATDLLPLIEEYMMASSISKMAEGAAKQIYHIREGRMSLLSGDVSVFPQGSAMGDLLRRMDEQEQALAELFTGKRITSLETATIYFDPAQTAVNQPLFRLSNTNGVVAADDLSGSPVYIRLNVDSKSQVNSAVKAAVALYYVLPVNGTIVIDDGKNQYFTGEFTFPQFGTVLPLGENVLTKSTRRVLIDNTTGRLLGIE
ncbi:MAG: DUF4831 family protein [Prevotellaceae bacterium]|jgi:hypothetical protein|nr:DUF4831 family protein [Prevotellaceae bacterium]